MKSKKGFTIIEVVLVLAIAGLIFLMVFVALPNMQKSQRDTQRRSDYAALASAVIQYSANNGGKVPASGTSALGATSLNSNGTDPSGYSYSVSIEEMTKDTKIGAPIINNDGFTSVKIITNADCGNGDVPTYTASNKAFVIYGALESGTYCSASSM